MALMSVILSIIAIISCIICIITLIALIYSIHTMPDNSRPHKVSIRYTYTAIVFFIISALMFSFNCLYKYPANMNIILYKIIMDISGLSWNLAQFFLYLLLFERVYHAFQGTKYSVSKYAIIFFVFLLLSYLLSSIVVSLYQNFQSYQSNAWNVSSEIYAIGEEIIDLILSVYLITIFIHKLLRITVDLNDSESEKFVNSQIGVLNEEQKKLIHLMTKYFILSFVATLTTQLESLLYCVGYFVMQYDNYLTLYISWILWPIDCAVNSVCLFLIFEVNEKWYRKLCKGCHAFIKLWFKRTTKRKLRKKYFGDENVELEINLLNDPSIVP